jgi:signal peptidase I
MTLNDIQNRFSNQPAPITGAPPAELADTYQDEGETPGTDTTPTPQPAAQSWKPVVRELVETIVLTLVIFLLIRVFVQNFRVDGMSMEPNFHDGQFLLISKMAYRVGEPQRGDVIVFRYPQDPSRDFIKRVVGLPGEVVQVTDGQVVVDGTPVPDLADVYQGGYTSAATRLGPEELYVMGDNRPNSSDSHTWGPLPTDLVIGKVVLSYWPPSTWGLVTTPTGTENTIQAESLSP